MAIFTIADLHLSLGTNKPMDEFNGWENYIEKIKSNWLEYVNKDDIVVIPGDISWGMSLAGCLLDFKFIEELPGQKVLIKGNHDYWWNTVNKMQNFFNDNNLSTLNIINNNCYMVDNLALCGTRSWLFDIGESKDEKIMNREKCRLTASLEHAKASGATEYVVFLHYPPVSNTATSEEIIKIMHNYGVKECYYGHLHGHSIYNALQGEIDGINYKLISADALGFKPFKIR